MTKYLGLDGCRAGWFMVSMDEDGDADFRMLCAIDELSAYLPDAAVALIDVPIGLRGRHTDERQCDREARKRLPPGRKSSVFPAPSRCALDGNSYAEASELNRACTGRGLSRQTFAIIPKICEVDRFMGVTPYRHKVREIHPEVCFWALNGERAMTFRKKSRAGYEERLAVLERYCPGAASLVARALGTYRRREVARDDVLDAFVGAVTAAHHGSLKQVPDVPERDETGLPMEIVFAMTV
ncbi:hypothetical protein B1C78_02070 [Thioalkalivibrio denitrificans]|uniref:DUF429 domain-containing protein n=1 Tax=Thioalkalivibrio denitrificans TaxID=108003 RepID=A0A1V3NSR9_9GAMM|nr:DUF429 domain-containing protein [Thioalkalivibrio denitrificans]OOG28155.1 hypothetical protein B1C78_02070 [Thioalkalivibrio denitrificans]